MKKITLTVFLLTTFAINAQYIDEGFNNIFSLTNEGYTSVNVSDVPVGEGFFPGNPDIFSAFDGDPETYVASNFSITTGSIIDSYMILPSLDLKNGDRISFYTRTATATKHPDRLEVRIDSQGTGTLPEFGNTGSFDTLLLSINPDLELDGAYPENWQQYEVIISGLPENEIINTRIALRYWVTKAGENGTNSNYIGIDRLVVEDPTLGLENVNLDDFDYYIDSNNLLNISASFPIEQTTIYSIDGQQVRIKQTNKTTTTIDISSLQEGMYIGTVVINGTPQSFKFVKK